MTDPSAAALAGGRDLVALFDSSVEEVFGYLVSRCGSAAVAEDLTSEVYLAAVDRVRRSDRVELSVGWLITVARNKLVDHWRRREREDRKLALVDDTDVVEDDWDVRLDVMRAHEVLGRLGAHHRSALTLRYLDGLPVPEVAEHLDRTVHATEALLVRARRAFRHHYEQEGGEGR